LAVLQWIRRVRALRMRCSQLYPVSRAHLPASYLGGLFSAACYSHTDRPHTQREIRPDTLQRNALISQTTLGVLVRLPDQHFTSNRYVTTVSHCFFLITIFYNFYADQHKTAGVKIIVIPRRAKKLHGINSFSNNSVKRRSVLISSGKQILQEI